MTVLRIITVLLVMVLLESSSSEAQEKGQPNHSGSRLRLTLDFDALVDE